MKRFWVLIDGFLGAFICSHVQRIHFFDGQPHGCGQLLFHLSILALLFLFQSQAGSSGSIDPAVVGRACSPALPEMSAGRL